MKKFLSIILAILMIVTSVPMAFAVTGTDEPVTINITGKEYISIGQGTAYYDEDGYIITGKSETAQIDVTESCDITLENTTFCTMYLIGDNADVKLTLEGESFCGSSENERPGINIYNSNLIIEGGEDDSLTYNGIKEMICTSNLSGTVTVNSGKIISNIVTDKNYGSIECSDFVINGGEVTLSSNDSYVCKTVLYGGVLNIENTSSDKAAIDTDIIMKKGALLTVSAEGELLSSWHGFDGYYANIFMADGAGETDYFFVRYDKTSEFTPVRDIRAALNGRDYAEIKTETHQHSFDRYGYCICGNNCAHKNVTDNNCPDCGAKGDLVTITMTDSFGDGWYDNAIVIEEFVGQESKKIGTATMLSDENDTFITFFGDDYAYRFRWVNGYHPEECGFTVAVNGEAVYEASDVSFVDGEVFYIYCKHSLENGKCTKCGAECGVDFEHNFENYTCTVCGKYIYKIVHPPTAEELRIGLNNDIGATFQWCTVSYDYGKQVYTPVDGWIYSYIENPVGGNEYACIVTFKDGTTETSDSVKIHGCDVSGEWKSDGEKHWKECECGNTGEEAAHSYDSNIWEYNEEDHQAKCKCGHKAAAEAHAFENFVCIKCPFYCDHLSFDDDLCETCGYICKHEIINSEIVSRPVQNDDGTWGKGSAKNTCSLCKKDFSTTEIERDHEGYKLFEEACENFELLLEREDIVEDVKKGMQNTLADLINKAEEKVYTELEKDYIASLISNIEGMEKDIEEGLADGTMVKADFSGMTVLLDEIYALLNGDFDRMIYEMYAKYLDAVEYYNMYCDDSTYSQFFYDFYGYESDLVEIIDAIKDGTALKADYTEIDEAIAEAEKKYADENLTDEAKAGLDEIKAQLEKMKADENTSVADVSKLAKELEAYETELDAGIADGSAVEVNGLEEIIEINDALNNDLAEKYGEEALAEIVEKIGEKLDKEIEAVYEKAEALIGSVAENADALAEIEAEMAEIFAKVENCLNGTHNGLYYAVTEEAKCGKNAIESATCILCDEVLTREVENSALKHSFTKYETVEEAKCGVSGKAVAYCDNACGETDEKAIDALTHKDADGDYKCDNGCGHEFEKPVTPDEPNTPDEPDTPDEPTDSTCDHLCHKSGFIGFIWKIVQFFSKLFKINPVCECGAAHY